jgi:hypothetical protein
MDQGLFMLRAKEIWDNRGDIVGPPVSPVVEGDIFFKDRLFTIRWLYCGLWRLTNKDITIFNTAMIFQYFYISHKELFDNKVALTTILIWTLCQ